MATYTIKPASIAAMCHVIHPNGTQLDYVYLAAGKLPEGTPTTNAYCPWRELPTAVQSEVCQHFGKVFAIPLEWRGEYIKNNSDPWTVQS